MKFPCQCDGGLVPRFLKPVDVSLQFHIHIFAANSGNELLQQLTAAVIPFFANAQRQRAVFVAG